MATELNRAKNGLVESIRSGRYSVGELLPPVEKLAPRMKCADATLRKALVALADEGVLRRVKRKGTLVARQPRLGRVGLVLSTDAHLNGLLVYPIYSRLQSIGYDVELVPYTGSFALLAEHRERLERGRDKLAAVIGIGPPNRYTPDGEAYFNEMAGFSRRVFTSIADHSQDLNALWVGVDYQREARLVVDHLIALGHRRIAVPHLGRPGYVADMATTFKDLVEVAGARCFFVPFFDDRDDGWIRRAVRQERVTAVWTINDHQALLAYAQLSKAGLRVPTDVSIVGRNDTPWSVQGPSPLTTLSINPDGFADAVARAVDKARNGEPVAGLVAVEPIFVPRTSTGRASSERRLSDGR